MTTMDADRRAFERELIALIPQLRAFGRSLSGNATEGDDLAQETLEKALSARASFTLGTNLKAWTFFILRNQFISGKRRSWRATALDPAVAAETLVASDRADSALELDDVRRGLAMLPLEQREALILIGAAGMAYEDAADVLSVPCGTIKSRVSRGRLALSRILAEGALARDGCPPSAAMDAILRAVETAQVSRTPRADAERSSSAQDHPAASSDERFRAAAA